VPVVFKHPDKDVSCVLMEIRQEMGSLKIQPNFDIVPVLLKFENVAKL
jgi:hypothetical protein